MTNTETIRTELTTVEVLGKTLAESFSLKWDGMTHESQREYSDAAFNVALKLLDASKTMIDAGGSALDDCKDSGYDSGGDGNSYNSYEYIMSGSQTTIFRAMIQAALDEYDNKYPE